MRRHQTIKKIMVANTALEFAYQFSLERSRHRKDNIIWLDRLKSISFNRANQIID